MVFNLPTTAILCVFASITVHAHNYTVKLTGMEGHKASYHGTLPEFVRCDTCKPLNKTSYYPTRAYFLTENYSVKGKPDLTWELRFYTHPLCTDKQHLIVVSLMAFSAPTLWPSAEGWDLTGDWHLTDAKGFSVCRVYD
ncbi:hypothetical protein BJ138DRAFT_1120178 [Hygrophoropsis aurantiaca]|uniref:Uncharacterized protein n=1 Tax=Hygrophoropsis aurantiaca TaxID=72124 RepID=A0ACB7ZSJ3_9AGAM|nr:hypothetical protein BJ138DRAFT_1120178 [Hygrophoropsis aurantiaca]